MQLLKTLPYIAALLLGITLSAPAAAQSWGVTATPSTSSDGTVFCMMWFGDQMPMMNITAVADRQQIVVQAEELAAVPEGTSGALNFDSGRSIDLPQVSKANANAVLAPLSSDAFSTVLAEIALGGTVTVSVGSAAVQFPLADAAGEAAGLRECAGQL